MKNGLGLLLLENSIICGGKYNLCLDPSKKSSRVDGPWFLPQTLVLLDVGVPLALLPTTTTLTIKLMFCSQR